MRSIRFFNFHGVTPLRDDSLLEAAHAMIAENVDLSRGDLLPWKVKSPIDSSNAVIIEIAEPEACPRIKWNSHVEHTFGQPVCSDIGLMFWIEGGVVKQAYRHAACTGGDTLGVPPPGPPAIGGGPAGEECTTYASYCATTVNSYGQESAPSAPTPIVPSNVNVSAGSGGGTNIYQAIAGPSTGRERANAPDGEWFLMNGSVGSHAEMLITTRWGLPPTGVTSLAVCEEANTLMLAVKNTIFVSEPGQYHAYPRDRDIVLQDNIVALRSYNGVIVALTDGHPYVITPRRTSEGSSIYEIERMDESLPCLSIRSVSVGSAGVVWASTDGLFLLGHTRFGMRIACLTDKLFHLNDWRDVNPTTVRGEVYNGAYYFSADGGVKNSITRHVAYTWILTFNDSIYEHPSNVELTTLDLIADGWFRSRRDKFYYSVGNELFEWNPRYGLPVPYVYATRLTVDPGLTNFAAAKVIHDRDGDLEFELWTEKCSKPLMVFSRKINHCNPFRLPRCFMDLDYYVVLRGYSRVRRVHLATSIAELSFDKDTTYDFGNKRLTARAN